jgi:Transposase DDE domain
MLDVKALAPKLHAFFTQTAQSVAQTSGFVKRTSKLTGPLFLQVLTLGFLGHPSASLTDLVETGQDLGVTITKQGLQTRLEEAVPFLQAMFQQGLTLFRNTLRLELTALQSFSAIYLTDSSIMALPPALQSEFPGCGGDGPEAALKIQVTFEFLRGTFTALTLQSSRSPDQIYTDDLHPIQAGALYLTDLGYFALTRFQTLAAHQAYFLSRLDTQTALVDETTHKSLDLLTWLRTQSENLFEQPFLLGQRAGLPIRLVGARMPQEVIEQRHRKAYDNARRKGRTPSARHLEWLKWSLFITNVPSSQLPPAQVLRLYHVRWQIELIFKLWKSHAALARVAGWRRPRILSELYAKLIGLVLTQFIMAPYRDCEDELSPVKVLHILQHYVPQFIVNLGNVPRLSETLATVVKRWLKNGTKDKRRKRLTTYQELASWEASLA